MAKSVARQAALRRQRLPWLQADGRQEFIARAASFRGPTAPASSTTPSLSAVTRRPWLHDVNWRTEKAPSVEGTWWMWCLQFPLHGRHFHLPVPRELLI
jgi:hypothetical protein